MPSLTPERLMAERTCEVMSIISSRVAVRRSMIWMSVRAAGIGCILSPQAVLRHNRQVVGCDASQRRAHDLVAHDAEPVPGVEAVEAKERKASRERPSQVHPA